MIVAGDVDSPLKEVAVAVVVDEIVADVEFVVEVDVKVSPLNVVVGDVEVMDDADVSVDTVVGIADSFVLDVVIVVETSVEEEAGNEVGVVVVADVESEEVTFDDDVEVDSPGKDVVDDNVVPVSLVPVTVVVVEDEVEEEDSVADVVGIVVVADVVDVVVEVVVLVVVVDVVVVDVVVDVVVVVEVVGTGIQTD